jgi:HemY protein
MIRLIVFLVVAVALAWVATWLVNNPGSVSLTWQGMQIETSVAVAIVAVAAVAIVAVILFEILRWLRQVPVRVIQAHRRSRRDKGYNALSQGLVAAAAGDAAQAKVLNRRAEKLLEQAPPTLLLSAQTAQLEGDEGTARIKFQEMLKHRETAFLGLRGLLAQAIKDGDSDTALQLARRAYQRRPNTPWVLTTLFELQTQAGLWTEALSTVGDMARYRLIDRATANRRRAILFHQAALASRTKGRPYEALELARKAHKRLPGLAPIAADAAALAAELNKPRLARKMLEASWRVEPHPDLARSYAALDGQAPADRMKRVERLHQLQPDHLVSELSLAEQALSDRQWQTARAALERALKREPTATVYRLLAELEHAEGDGEKARRWLAKAVDAPPDPAWLCQTTGEVRARWSAFGPDGRFDSLRWGQPPKIVPLLGGDRAELIPPPPPVKPEPKPPLPVAPAVPVPRAGAPARAPESRSGAGKAGVLKVDTTKAGAPKVDAA